MEKLELELKQLVISTLNLSDLGPEDIIADSPLFGEGIGLDSIDALELGVAIKKKYKVVLSVEDGDIKRHFYSIKSLAEFIQKSSEVSS